MVAIKLTVQGSAFKKIRSSIDRTKNLEWGMKLAERIVRKNISREFSSERHDGGKKWNVRILSKGKKLLNGPIRKGWTSRGSKFSKTRITQRSLSITNSAPFTDFHRGVKGGRVFKRFRIVKPVKLVKSNRNWSSPQKFAMWWWFLFNLSVVLTERKMKTGIRIPTRPHATWSRKINEKISKIFSEGLFQ